MGKKVGGTGLSSNTDPAIFIAGIRRTTVGSLPMVSFRLQLRDPPMEFSYLPLGSPKIRARDHCGLMPANLITFVHLSIFSAMNLANSSGEFGGTATAPRSANRCLMLGSSTAALVCLLSVAMISDGVPLGKSEIGNRTMDDRIIELLYRNLQEVFGEGDAARRRAAIRDFYTEDSVLYAPPGVFVGHDALDKFAGDLRATHPHFFHLILRPDAD